MSKSTTLRILMMLKIIPKFPASILVKDLQMMLEEEGFSVDLRTVQRDLRSLQDMMGLDYERSDEGLRWQYARVNTEMLPNMLPSEALLLVIAEEYLNSVLPNESLGLLEPRLDKAKTTLDKDKKLGKWRDKLAVVSGEIPLISNPIEESIRSVVYDCILKEEQIRILYRKRHGQDPIEYLLNPQGLIVRDHSQYLVAIKAGTGEQRQFVLSKIESAERQHINAKFSGAISFQDFLSSNPTGFVLEEAQPICLNIKSVPARILLNNRLSEDQKLKKLDGEWFEVKATCYITYDLIGWICHHAHAVKVVEPKVLVKEIRERLMSGLANC